MGLTLSHYDNKIVYKAGKQHNNAAMLSKLSLAATPADMPVPGT